MIQFIELRRYSDSEWVSEWVSENNIPRYALEKRHTTRTIQHLILNWIPNMKGKKYIFVSYFFVRRFLHFRLVLFFYCLASLSPSVFFFAPFVNWILRTRNLLPILFTNNWWNNKWKWLKEKEGKICSVWIWCWWYAIQNLLGEKKHRRLQKQNVVTEWSYVYEKHREIKLDQFTE